MAVELLIGKLLALVALVLGLEDVLPLQNAAKRLQITAITGPGIVARVYVGATGEKIRGELLDAFFPIDKLLCGERGLDERAVAVEPGEESGASIANVSRELLIAGADFGEDETAQNLIAVKGEAGVERQLHVVRAGKLPRL